MVLVNYPVSNRKRYRKVRSRAARVRNNKKKILEILFILYYWRKTRTTQELLIMLTSS